MVDSVCGNPSVRVCNGSIYLDREIYRSYFANLESIILFRRARKIFITTAVHTRGGGHLAKICNARGDRVVHAREFLCDCGLDEARDQTFPVSWNPGLAALEIGIPLGAFPKIG